jgi:hypothetical protein
MALLIFTDEWYRSLSKEDWERILATPILDPAFRMAHTRRVEAPEPYYPSPAPKEPREGEDT